MHAFMIQGVIERQDEYGHAFTTVNVAMCAKTWLKAKRQGKLGILYGVDISNALSRSHGIAAYNPTVDDARRSVKGLKLIRLTYYCKPKDNVPKLRLVHIA